MPNLNCCTNKSNFTPINSAWSPTTVPQGLQLWLKDPTSGSVTTWTDSSSKSNNFIQVPGSTAVTYLSTGLNGKPAMQATHPGSSAMRVHTDAPMLTGTSAERHMVIITDAFGPSGGGWGAATGPSPAYDLFLTADFFDSFGSTVEQRALFGGLGFSASTPLIYSVRATTGGWTAYINGCQVYTTTSNTFHLDSAAEIFGSTGNGGGNIVIAEVILYNGITNSSDFNQTISYLISKFSIPWSPLQVEQGCPCWLKDITSSSAVNWVDVSYSGQCDFTSPQTAQNPTYLATGLNGLPAMQGTVGATAGSCMPLRNGPTTKIFTGTSAERHMVMIGDLTDGLPCMQGWGTVTTDYAYVAYLGDIYDPFCITARASFPVTLTAGKAFVYSVRSGGGFFTAYINGVQVYQVAATFQHDTFAKLFGGSSTGNASASAYLSDASIVAEVICYNGITGTNSTTGFNDFTSTIAYLKTKYSIT